MSFTESLVEIVAANENGLLGAHSSWERVPLAEVASILNGFPFSSKQFKATGGVPLIRIRDVVRGWTETNYIGEFEPKFLVRHGDLIVGMDGDFRCALWTGGESLLNQRVCKISPSEHFYDKRLLVHALQGYLSAINAQTSAVTVKHLSSRTVAEIPLPLPPRREQKRLTEAIDSYFTRLDDAEATLERVQRNLKRYRASVLKAAVEGRLVPTEAELARAEGRDYEPASVLLERILAERRRRSEASAWRGASDTGRRAGDGRRGSKYQGAAPLDPAQLSNLPAGWCWGSLGQLGSVSGGLTQNAKRADFPVQVPFLRVANVYAEELRLDDVRTIGVAGSELDRVRLAPGDLLIVEGNGSIEQIGRVALWDGSVEPCLHQNHLIKVRFEMPELARWVLFWLLSPPGRVTIEQVASSTSGLHTLSISKVEQLPVPIPPLKEQSRATGEVERLRSSASVAAGEVRRGIARCARLRQSILKWAFEGRLVDQDPNDEPASVLLERIRAERETAQPRARGRGKRPGRRKVATESRG